MQISLEGKRALVTGANSGIGAGIARALSEAGAKVAINYVMHPEVADSMVKEIAGAGREALGVAADVGDAAQVAKMFAHLDREWGGIDLLVNNAGIDGPRALAWDADPAAWARVLNINLVGAFHCAHEALKRMVAQKGGVILNMTSVHERIPWSGYSAYAASKAGLSMLTQTLAQEASPHGVRVVSLAPGAIQTPINQNVWNDPAGLRDLLTKIPLGRMGTVEDVARVAVFLLSDAAAYVTGSSVFVDGAMTDYPEFGHGG